MILVPARGGSKRLPGKNLKVLGDRSLLARVADTVADSGLDVAPILSTDDPAIAEEGRRLGMSVPFTRPAAISDDASPTIDAVLHALDWHKEAHGVDPDTLMLLQTTSPFRTGPLLRDAVTALAGDPDAGSVIAMSDLHLPAGMVFGLATDGAATPVSAGADRPALVPNGALYLTRTAALRRERSLYAGRILPVITNPLRSIDIDTPEDWRIAEALLAAGLPPATYEFSAGPSSKENVP